ncbi:MAG: hypothetical protein LBT88_06010 [Oscillospiraceae bacterium]|nr:hypothetical protein [Oscillospiraceae bacterium]
MTSNTYQMRGSEGKLYLTVNGFIMAYAESFTAVLKENCKPYSFRGVRMDVPINYSLTLTLRGLSMPNTDIAEQVIKDLSRGQLSDFVFKGYYKTNGGDLAPITLHRCIPLYEDLDMFLNGEVSEWDFEVRPHTSEQYDIADIFKTCGRS